MRSGPATVLNPEEGKAANPPPKASVLQKVILKKDYTIKDILGNALGSGLLLDRNN